MSNFASAFKKGKAFMAFITCGDPDLETTAKAIGAAVAGGADIIELNIPFSDPTAVDPVIQEANVRALSKGLTTDMIFDFVRQLRPNIPVPVVFSTYANVVFSYGTEKFVRICSEIGVDGLILPDVPYEERQEFLPVCKRYDVTLISMVAVTSKERAAAISAQAEGFLYIMACPGNREEELIELTGYVRENTSIPCVICLNGTEEDRFAVVAAKTDGVAVDAPIVAIVAKNGKRSAKPVQEFVAAMKQVINS